jgi:ribonuclease R
MSYKECYRILTEPQPEDEKEYGEIIPMLFKMKELAEILKSMREKRGAIGFEMPETKVVLNDDGTVQDIMPYPINFTNGIIESFMICANEFVAKQYAQMEYPFVYRVHEDPDPIKIARFSLVARNLGAIGRLSGKITPLDIVNFTDTIADEKVKPVADELLLRSMAKARYSSQCLGHFGLASKYYCHFTSPIRRYPDLYIHRIIKSVIHEENKKSHFSGLVERAAEQSSEMERNAVDAERASVDIKVCDFMSDKVGEHYEGTVSSIIDVGFFVVLPSSIEGFVPFRSLADHYYFDERRYCAVGAHTGTIISIGLKVDVIVENVDTELNRIDFSLENDFIPRPSGRNSGKQGKVSGKGKGKERRTPIRKASHGKGDKFKNRPSKGGRRGPGGRRAR